MLLCKLITCKTQLFFPSSHDEFVLYISSLCLVPLVTKSIRLQRQVQRQGEKDNQWTRAQIGANTRVRSIAWALQQL